jgi:inosine-uridine nucleoside N-ribohydrolase
MRDDTSDTPREAWWVDTDPGLGLPMTDVDDALALLHLLAWEVPVAGWTTCYGNSALDRTDRVARSLGARFGVPVVRGARGPGDEQTEAAEVLAAHRGPVLALAPLTNVAAALRRGAAWSELVVLGGTDRRLPNLRVLHTTELNLAVDEAAAAVVLPVTDRLCTMEVCRRVRFGRAELASAPDWVRRGARSWLWTSPLRTGRWSFYPWDLLPAAQITHPSLFTTAPVTATLRSAWGYRGRVELRPGGRTTWLADVDVEGFLALWKETCARLR